VAVAAERERRVDGEIGAGSHSGGEMKVSFFLLKFPLASETFVLNQIVAFINMGYEVEIVALHKGDLQTPIAPGQSIAWRKNPLATG
jgi:hypothetical protein